MDSAAFLFQLALAGIFALSGVTKFLDRAGTGEAVRAFGVPDRFVSGAASLLPGSELLGAALVVLPATARLGAGLLGILLGVFIVGMVANLAQGRKPDCRCFGQVHSAPISWWLVARNFLLLSMVAIVLIQGGTSVGDAFRWVSRLDSSTTDLFYFVLLLAALGGVAALALWRKQVALAGQLGGATTTAPTISVSQLPIGEAAPSFAVSDLSGRTVTLATLLKQGHPTLLVFTSPNCPHCDELMPDIAKWQSSLHEAVTVAVVSSGTREENAEKANAYRLGNVLLQESFEVLDAYGGGGTPSGIALSEDGLVTSELGAGPEGVRAILTGIMANRVADLWHQATGESLPTSKPGLDIGAEIPDVVAPAPSGIGTRLGNLIEGRRTMIMFWSATCGFCDAILGAVRQHDHEWAESPERQLIFICNGPSEANANLGLKSRVVLDPEFSIAPHFGASGTPSAVVVADGLIDSELAVGTDEVLDLLRRQSQPERDSNRHA